MLLIIEVDHIHKEKSVIVLINSTSSQNYYVYYSNEGMPKVIISKTSNRKR